MRPAWKERKGQTTQGDRRVSGSSMVPWVEMWVQEGCGNSAVCPDTFSKACLSHSCGAGTLVRGRGGGRGGSQDVSLQVRWKRDSAYKV